MIQDSTVTIFTDGSSRGNPGPGGFGAVVAFSFQLSAVRDEKKKKGGDEIQIAEIGGGEAHTTNNRMELTAAIAAFDFLKSKIFNLESRIFIYSDSSYLINGITKWIHGWKKKSWITSAKAPVENQNLWETLDSLTTGKNIEWKYIGGHVGIAGNERCDEIATAFADGKNPKLYEGPLSSYPIKNILETNHNVSKQNQKSESRSRSGKKAYSYLSLIGGKIEIHKTWAECEKRVKGANGARFKKSFDVEDEAEIIREWKSPA